MMRIPLHIVSLVHAWPYNTFTYTYMDEHSNIQEVEDVHVISMLALAQFRIAHKSQWLTIYAI